MVQRLFIVIKDAVVVLMEMKGVGVHFIAIQMAEKSLDTVLAANVFQLLRFLRVLEVLKVQKMKKSVGVVLHFFFCLFEKYYWKNTCSIVKNRVNYCLMYKHCYQVKLKSTLSTTQPSILTFFAMQTRNVRLAPVSNI